MRLAWSMLIMLGRWKISQRKLLVFDLFSGTGSATQAFHDAGHTIIKIEIDEYFKAHERDILALNAAYLVKKYGQPNFIWASPPCTSFSVASIGHHWNLDRTPKTDEAFASLELVKFTLRLIKDLNPQAWLMENPRGMLRKQAIMQGLERREITYCAYGEKRMKPTDLWGSVPNWDARKSCKNGDKCHEAAPRGARTGTQGLKGARIRSMIPYQLGLELLDAFK
jgi:hypothetical protein